jgi:serine/threonine-protein kinase
MLTGEKPFTGEQLTTVVYKIVAEDPIPPHRLNSTLSQPISNVLRRALAKKADARYANCQKFVDALEAACAAAKGWRPLARGGSHNLPTAMEARRPGNIAPARSSEETKPRKRRKVGILPVLAAILVAAGLVVLIAWQAAPWLAGPVSNPSATQTQPPAAEPKQPSPAAVEEKKPSPMPPATVTPESSDTGGATAADTPRETAPERGPIPEPAPGKEQAAGEVRTAGAEHVRPVQRRTTPDLASSPYLKISVSTIPSDATAMLDNRPDSACTTPCALDAMPGPHMVSFSRAGYQTENRPVTVAGTAVELPPVALRVPGGVLMLASVPAGARIFVNGAPSDQVTPAKLELRPGTYAITLEKDGKRSTKQVEIQNGITRIEKIIMDR